MISYARKYTARPCVKCGETIAVPHGPQRYCAPCGKGCSVKGCNNAARSKGLCSTHRLSKFPVPTFEPIDGLCGVQGCGRVLKQRGLCMLHYGRIFRTGSVGAVKATIKQPVNVPCLVEGCGRPSRGRGYCGTHYSRYRLKGDVDTAELQRAAQGSGSISDTGYRLIRAGGRVEFEHRLVMEAKLGRPLREKENVHHIDGDKLNNHPANLELWTTAQPSGQRVSDRISAATRFLTDHGISHEVFAQSTVVDGMMSFGM